MTDVIKHGDFRPCTNSDCKNYRRFSVKYNSGKPGHSLFCEKAKNRSEQDVMVTSDWFFIVLLTCMVCVHFERSLDVSKILDDTVRV